MPEFRSTVRAIVTSTWNNPKPPTF